MKDLQVLAKEYSLGYENEEQQVAAFFAYCDGYRKALDDKYAREDWDLAFAAEEFRPIMYNWLIYKKEMKCPYKTQVSMEACYKNLYKMSDGDPVIAKKIVMQSMANNYQGLFELKSDFGDEILVNWRTNE